MSSEVEEAEIVTIGGLPWYSKIFECVKNRNRIAPSKLELPNCDFLNVGPRRTLRILIPKPSGSDFYDQGENKRPETIDENFVSRWAMRPHPSGNCRCSFRQSNRFSTNEERILTAEINRIRTSLCEAEKTGEDIKELEQRISLNLEGLNIINDQPLKNSRDTNSVGEKLAEIGNIRPPIGNKTEDDTAIKNKIVHDLEKYIEVLLQEVINDTMKFFTDSSETLKKSRNALKDDVNFPCDAICADPKHLYSCNSSVNDAIKIRDNSKKADKKIHPFKVRPLNISFAFHEPEVEESKEEDVEKSSTQETLQQSEDVNGGYVNRAFSGSNGDPDSLDFDLHKPVNTEITLDNLDCIDSGINSVETIEFQPSQEPSLEQSLMEIIDAKLGRAPLKRSWEDLSDKSKDICKNLENIENVDSHLSIDVKDSVICIDKLEGDLIEKNEREIKDEIEDIVEVQTDNLNLNNRGESSGELEKSEEPSFDKLRLELIGNGSENKKSLLSAFREKFSWEFRKNRTETSGLKEVNINNEDISTSPVELRVQRKESWHSPELSVVTQNESPDDFVKFRKSKKPIIVFLHGFGSSAEIFEHQLDYFTSLGYPCVAPEMLGHGMSSAPDRSRDYQFDKLLNDLDIVLQHYAFKPGRKCIIVAHNYGCSFATALACKYDSKIHQLVLISGGSPTPLAPPSSEGAGHCCLRAILTPLLMCGLHRDILYSARGRQHPYCGQEPPEQWPSHMKYVLDGMVWPEGDYVFHRRITTPTLLIHGLRDDKVSLVQECQMERTIIKAFLDAIPTAGHTPMTDCPEQVNHMIHCFIDLWRRKKRRY